MNHGDRRTRVRLEVVGALRAMLALDESAHILNISAGGALITCPLAPPINSQLSLHFPLGLGECVLAARVRHHSPVTGAEGSPRRYTVGIEFISPTADVAALIDALGSPPEES